MTLQEEKEIIRRVIGGDKNAFEDLVIENQKNVYNLALKMIKNADDAMDISQDAFIKAYRSLGSFRADSRFSVWLYKLTYNLCIDAYRKSSSTKALPLEYEDDEGQRILNEIPDIQSLPEDRMLRRETRRNIADGIDKLPLKLREIIIMREITGMSYDEISMAIGVGLGTVKSRLSRARLKLVDILVKSGTFPESYRPNS